MREWGLSVFTLRREPPPFIHPHGPSRCCCRCPTCAFAPLRALGRGRGGGDDPRRAAAARAPSRSPLRGAGRPAGRTPGLGPPVVVKRRRVGRREREPAAGEAKMGGGRRAGGAGWPGGSVAAAAWPGTGAGLGPLAAPACGSGHSLLPRSHAGWRRGRAGPRTGGREGAACARRPRPGPARTLPGPAGGAGGRARGAHNGPSRKGRARPVPPRLQGSGRTRAAGSLGKESFSRGRELKRRQNKAAAAAAHGAGRGPGGGAPTRYLRAGGRRGPARSPRAPKLCAREGGRRARVLGAARPGRHPHSVWALLTRVGSPRAGLSTSRVVAGGAGPGGPWWRRGTLFGRPLAGERGAGGQARLGGSGGRAAMFLRGGLRGGEGGGHGGDCAPPPIVPGLGLGPRATGTAVAEPPPLWAGLGGEGWGTQRRGGAPASPPRSGLGAAGRRAAAAGKRVGGLPCPAGPDSDPPPPGGRAENRRAARPLVRHVLPARAP
ncbi:translation initiation factor IF-2-like [Cervus canadensis]|uniref:translation initiation factor IF-2-like n=1 Tax=Cervus canadensis TaxID=1574408 RepID=UPI001C9E2E68|nr:translation initiation factor IF-2-like [Cervus canadensis]